MDDNNLTNVNNMDDNEIEALYSDIIEGPEPVLLAKGCVRFNGVYFSYFYDPYC